MAASSGTAAFDWFSRAYIIRWLQCMALHLHYTVRLNLCVVCVGRMLLPWFVAMYSVLHRQLANFIRACYTLLTFRENCEVAECSFSDLCSFTPACTVAFVSANFALTNSETSIPGPPYSGP